jgi:chromosome condensin MukBEF MukE localization factor
MLKKIVLLSAATDNAGKYRDAGSELAIGDEPEDGVISAAAAQTLIDDNRAVSKTEAERVEREAERAEGQEEEQEEQDAVAADDGAAPRASGPRSRRAAS